jgi:cholesterol transport system auxiliary component
MTLRSALACVTLACCLAGCSITTPAPARNTFLPRAEPSLAVQATAPLPGLLLVNVFAVAEAFAGKPMVYRFEEHRYETDFYNEFLVSPRDFISQGALEWMQRAHVFESVAPAAGARAPRALLLQGSVNELYADLRDAQRPAAVLSIQFYLVDETQPARPLRTAGELRRAIPIADASAAAFAAGVSRAMTEIFGELEERLRTAAVMQTQ